MTIYLLDENVLRELHAKGNEAVRAWYATVATDDIRISVMTLFEKRRGWERRARKEPTLAKERLADLDTLQAAYADRIVPIDEPVAREWARLLGAKNKDRLDRSLVATARVHGFVLVTRNVADMRGCSVQVLDPFRRDPDIIVV